MSLRPLISIIGATGTGKSQLAIELAKRFNGEIINADAMQMYRGLEIITNKHPVAEREGIQHHLMDFVPVNEVVNVLGFEERALKTISEIRSRGKLPILVGGTHYYIQRLLLPSTLHEPPEHPTTEQLSQEYPILNAPTPEMLAKLEGIDPKIAGRWHPNDRRKIRRSLEIWLQTGRTPSEIYEMQREGKEFVSASTTSVGTGSDSETEGNGFDNLIFWTHAERKALCERLDSRVEKMITDGMFNEINELWETFQSLGGKMADGGAVDFEKGIWQSIGFKEFLPYLQASSEKEKTKELREQCVERMKSATRQYARTQEKWIRTKLMHAIKGSDILLYLLDTTALADYQHTAIEPAMKISQIFLSGGNPSKDIPPKSLSALAESCLSARTEFDFSQHPESWIKRTCESCNVTTVGDLQWEKHRSSGRHKKTVAKLRKREEIKEFLRRREEAKAAGTDGVNVGAGMEDKEQSGPDADSDSARSEEEEDDKTRSAS